MKKSRLNKVGKSETSQIKVRIQALLRAIVIIRDKGCFLKDQQDTELGECGGYRNDGELILQFDHLNSRANNISYAEPKLGVCVCRRHHYYHAAYQENLRKRYEELTIEFIGRERAKLLAKVKADRKPYPMSSGDWGLVEIALAQELKNLSTPPLATATEIK